VALFKRAEIAIEGGRAVQRQNKPFKYGGSAKTAYHSVNKALELRWFEEKGFKNGLDFYVVRALFLLIQFFSLLFLTQRALVSML
jgi:hypothetical protein